MSCLCSISLSYTQPIQHELAMYGPIYRLGVGLNMNVASVVLSSSLAVRRLCRHCRYVCRLSSLCVVGRPVRQLRFTQRLYTSYQPFRSNVDAEPFLDGTSAVYVEQLYEDWLQDLTSVHKVSNLISLSSDTHTCSSGLG